MPDGYDEHGYELEPDINDTADGLDKAAARRYRQPNEGVRRAEAEPKVPKFKRCKISRLQLVLLTQHFDEDPLPSFDDRARLAQQLGMTPRSVQIWFQNRRQRLLKPPPMRGEGGAADMATHAHNMGSGGVGDGQPAAPCTAALAAAPTEPHTMSSGAGSAHPHSGRAGMEGMMASGVPPAAHGHAPPPQAGWPPVHHDLARGLPPWHATTYAPPPHTSSLATGLPPPSHAAVATSSAIPDAPAHPYPVSTAGVAAAHHLAPSGLPAGVPLPSHHPPSSATQGGGSSTAGPPVALPLPPRPQPAVMMPTMSPTDLALAGLPHALALLPQAVAAGHVTPSSAAMLMQTLDAHVGSSEAVAAAGPPSYNTTASASAVPTWPPLPSPVMPPSPAAKPTAAVPSSTVPPSMAMPPSVVQPLGAPAHATHPPQFGGAPGTYVAGQSAPPPLAAAAPPELTHAPSGVSEASTASPSKAMPSMAGALPAREAAPAPHAAAAAESKPPTKTGDQGGLDALLLLAMRAEAQEEETADV